MLVRVAVSVCVSIGLASGVSVPVAISVVATCVCIEASLESHSVWFEPSEVSIRVWVDMCSWLTVSVCDWMDSKL